jgi:hypothetical protein
VVQPCCMWLSSPLRQIPVLGSCCVLQ